MPRVAVGRKKIKLRRFKGKKKSPPSASSMASPPWVELPVDVMANILQRLDPVDILTSAQYVCTTWLKVCLDSAIWRVIDMGFRDFDRGYPRDLEELCVIGIKRSQGQLMDINIEYFGTDDLLHTIGHASKHLRRLRIGSCNLISSRGLREAVENLQELEELHLFCMPSIEPMDIERIGTSCPKLKSFTFNNHAYKVPHVEMDNRYALAVARGMPNLCHLQLFANKMNDVGLKSILDGCPRLESLDVRQCFNIDPKGDVSKSCSEKLNDFKRPSESLDEFEWEYETYESSEDSDFYGDYEYYEDYSREFPDGEIRWFNDFDF